MVSPRLQRISAMRWQFSRFSLMVSTVLLRRGGGAGEVQDKEERLDGEAAGAGEWVEREAGYVLQSSGISS
ncbi:hypothetical protein ACFX2J_025090 [Malus domestica]